MALPFAARPLALLLRTPLQAFVNALQDVCGPEAAAVDSADVQAGMGWCSVQSCQGRGQSSQDVIHA